MDESLRRHPSGAAKSHPKKQRSGVTIASASSRSNRLSPGGSFAIQKGDHSGSEFTGDKPFQAGQEAIAAELPVRHSLLTEADSIWHESTKLFSVAVQPTEAHLNTHTSLHNLGTNSVGQTSVQDEKDEDASELIDLAPLSTEAVPNAALGETSRQHQAASPEHASGDRGGPSDKMASRYTRRWDSAPSPRRALDDSALEVDHSQQLRTAKSRQDKEKRHKPSDGNKLQNRGILEGNVMQAGMTDPSGIHAGWNAKHGRLMHEDSGLKDLTTGSTAIQTAAKQTSFLQRHVSAKAERAERHTHKLSETNLNSLEPRKEQRIDPKERILAWIEQGEAYLQSAILPRSSTQDLNSTPFQPVPSTTTGQTNASAKRESRSKAVKSSHRRKKKSGGFFSCLGCLYTA